MSGFIDLTTVEAVALGRFDGLHLGHKALIDRLGENGALVVVDTGRSNLTPPEFIGRFCRLPSVVYNLEEIRTLGAEEFLQKLLRDMPNLKRIVVGEDFRFGNNRSAGVDELRALFAGETIVVGEVKLDGVAVHSRYIRSLIVEGDVSRAARFLDRHYEIFGSVIRGQGIGTTQFVPTLNLEVVRFLLPAEGVYATQTVVEEREYASVSFVGHRLSTDGNFAVETHLLDEHIFTPDQAWIRFGERLRPNRYYERADELKEQILTDIREAKEAYQKLF